MDQLLNAAKMHAENLDDCLRTVIHEIGNQPALDSRSRMAQRFLIELSHIARKILCELNEATS